MTPELADPTPHWESLRAAIAGEVVLAGSAAFERLNTPFNARFHDVRPQAIVRCGTPKTPPRRCRSSAGTAFTARHGAEVTASRTLVDPRRRHPCVLEVRVGEVLIPAQAADPASLCSWGPTCS
jgi:hypothetical protein